MANQIVQYNISKDETKIVFKKDDFPNIPKSDYLVNGLNNFLTVSIKDENVSENLASLRETGLKSQILLLGLEISQEELDNEELKNKFTAATWNAFLNLLFVEELNVKDFVLTLYFNSESLMYVGVLGSNYKQINRYYSTLLVFITSLKAFLINPLCFPYRTLYRTYLKILSLTRSLIKKEDEINQELAYLSIYVEMQTQLVQKVTIDTNYTFTRYMYLKDITRDSGYIRYNSANGIFRGTTQISGDNLTNPIGHNRLFYDPEADKGKEDTICIALPITDKTMLECGNSILTISNLALFKGKPSHAYLPKMEHYHLLAEDNKLLGLEEFIIYRDQLKRPLTDAEKQHLSIPFKDRPTESIDYELSEYYARRHWHDANLPVFSDVTSNDMEGVKELFAVSFAQIALTQLSLSKGFSTISKNLIGISNSIYRQSQLIDFLFGLDRYFRNTNICSFNNVSLTNIITPYRDIVKGGLHNHAVINFMTRFWKDHCLLVDHNTYELFMKVIKLYGFKTTNKCISNDYIHSITQEIIFCALNYDAETLLNALLKYDNNVLMDLITVLNDEGEKMLSGETQYDSENYYYSINDIQDLEQSKLYSDMCEFFEDKEKKTKSDLLKEHWFFEYDSNYTLKDFINFINTFIKEIINFHNKIDDRVYSNFSQLLLFILFENIDEDKIISPEITKLTDCQVGITYRISHNLYCDTNTIMMVYGQLQSKKFDKINIVLTAPQYTKKDLNAYHKLSAYDNANSEIAYFLDNDGSYYVSSKYARYLLDKFSIADSNICKINTTLMGIIIKSKGISNRNDLTETRKAVNREVNFLFPDVYDKKVKVIDRSAERERAFKEKLEKRNISDKVNVNKIVEIKLTDKENAFKKIFCTKLEMDPSNYADAISLSTSLLRITNDFPDDVKALYDSLSPESMKNIEDVLTEKYLGGKPENQEKSTAKDLKELDEINILTAFDAALKSGRAREEFLNNQDYTDEDDENKPTNNASNYFDNVDNFSHISILPNNSNLSEYLSFSFASDETPLYYPLYQYFMKIPDSTLGFFSLGFSNDVSDSLHPVVKSIVNDVDESLLTESDDFLNNLLYAFYLPLFEFKRRYMSNISLDVLYNTIKELFKSYENISNVIKKSEQIYKYLIQAKPYITKYYTYDSKALNENVFNRLCDGEEIESEISKFTDQFIYLVTIKKEKKFKPKKEKSQGNSYRRRQSTNSRKETNESEEEKKSDSSSTETNVYDVDLSQFKITESRFGTQHASNIKVLNEIRLKHNDIYNDVIMNKCKIKIKDISTALLSNIIDKDALGFINKQFVQLPGDGIHKLGLTNLQISILNANSSTTLDLKSFDKQVTSAFIAYIKTISSKN